MRGRRSFRFLGNWGTSNIAVISVLRASILALCAELSDVEHFARVRRLLSRRKPGGNRNSAERDSRTRKISISNCQAGIVFDRVSRSAKSILNARKGNRGAIATTRLLQINAHARGTKRLDTKGYDRSILRAGGGGGSLFSS